MKKVKIVSLFVVVLVAGLQHAAAQSDSLNQLAAQLQKTPTDGALREKIIKLAATMKPAPVLSEEAARRMARGEAAFELAKDAGDYEKAIAEFQLAANAAPWYPDSYYNLGITQEKAGKAKDAMESFRFYLLAAPDAKDSADIKKRLYKLEYAAEQQTTAAADNAKQAAQKAKEQRLSGPWRRPYALNDGKPRLEVLYVRQSTDGKWQLFYDFYCCDGTSVKDQPWGEKDLTVVDGELHFKKINEAYDKSGICATYDVTGTVSADGNTLDLAYNLMPFAPDRPYGSCPIKSTHKSEVVVYKR